MKLKDKKIILLVTHKEDFYTIDKVYKAILKRDLIPLRLNTDEFPNSIEISIDFSGKKPLSWVKGPEYLINSSQIRSVWLRKFGIPKISQPMDNNYVRTCIEESTEMIKGLFVNLPEAFWLDPYYNIIKTENKNLQLQFAKKVGLEIPRTLISNSPEMVTDFYQGIKGEIVAKLQRPITVSMVEPTRFLYTSVVTKDDIAEIDSLRHCPMIFQERIYPESELRVIYVAGKFFTGRIKNDDMKNKQPDWRRYDNTFQWVADDIPVLIKEKIIRLMNLIGLNYGALDIIKTNDNKYVFLEINPSGEWGMLEKYIGFPISEAIADVLTQSHQ